jgi:hypothetical protein
MSGSPVAHTTAPRAAGPAGKWRAVWAKLGWAQFPLTLFAVTRAGMLLFSEIALSLSPELMHVGGPTFLEPYPALAGLCRWDCGWFDQLARLGYQKQMDTNFWPLYPLLARATSYVGLPVEFGLLFWGNLFCVGAYLVIYRIFLRLSDDASARWALGLLAAYPFSYFHSAAYPESLMLFFSALAILLALNGRHLWAGSALGVGILARHLTVIAGAGLLAAQIRAHRREPLRVLLHKDLLGLIVPFCIAGIYPLYCYFAFGDALSMLHARQAHWGADAWMPAWQVFTAGKPVLITYALFSLVPLGGALALLQRAEWAELAAYALCLMTVLFFVGGLGLGRYSASCWPAFLPLGVSLARRPNLQLPVVVTLAMFQGMFFYLWTHQYPIL